MITTGREVRVMCTCSTYTLVLALAQMPTGRQADTVNGAAIAFGLGFAFSGTSDSVSPDFKAMYSRVLNDDNFRYGFD